MKRCKNCVKVYGDWRTECPKCGRALVPTDPAADPETEAQSLRNKQKYKWLRRLLSFAQTVAVLVLIVGLGLIGFRFAVRAVGDALVQQVVSMDEQGLQSEVLTELDGYQALLPYHAGLQAAWDAHCDPYREDAIRRTSEAFESSGHAAAMAVLEEAMAVLENDDELQRVWEMYDYARPRSLLNWQAHDQGAYLYVGPVDFDQFAQYWDEVAMDRVSGQYDPAGVHFVSHVKKPDDADLSVSYTLNGEGAWLSGVAYLPAISERAGFAWSIPAMIQIYGDGELIYTTTIMQHEAYPERFRIGIDGVQELKILMTSGWRSETFDEGRYYPKICLAELCVERPLGSADSESG